MAGWQAYIKNLLDSSPCIKKGAIIGANDGSVWAKSDGELGAAFNPSSEECQNFANLWNNLNDAPMHGFRFEGQKFIVPRVEENFLLGKQGKTGVMATKTKMAILVAVYEGEAQEGIACRNAVEHLGEYLKQQGY